MFVEKILNFVLYSILATSQIKTPKEKKNMEDF